MPEPGDKKRRRIRGEHFWAIRKCAQEVDDTRRALQDATQDEAKALNLYPDQVNWDSGATFQVAGDERPNGHIPQDALARITEKARAFKEAQKALRDKLNIVAEIVGTWPDVINPATGEITDDSCEVVPAPKVNA
jgi:hypothetical protein